LAARRRRSTRLTPPSTGLDLGYHRPSMPSADQGTTDTAEGSASASGSRPPTASEAAKTVIPSPAEAAALAAQAASVATAFQAPEDAEAAALAAQAASVATAFQAPEDAEAAAAGDADATIDTDAWLGRTIDNRYKIVELLGEGGMGAVFVAEHLSLRKQVALKVIRPEYAGIPEIAARFTREAMATAKLDHPHVASALDYGMLPDGAAFLVIQLVRGKPLRSLLDERSLPWPVACDIVGQIADALAGAHAEGIVHRDLKPDNVLLELRDDGRYLAKVVDFGIARVATDAASHGPAPGEGLTRMGMVMGTPGYMSPEQALGEQIDHRTDLYAVGVLLWESIAGRPLFRADSLTELIAKQLSDAPPPLATILGQPIPEVVDELILQLLARSPTARPNSAAEIRDTLRKIAAAGMAATDGEVVTLPGSGFGTMRRTELAPTYADAPAGPSLFSKVETLVRERWRDDRRSVIAVAGIAGLLLLIGLFGLCGGDGDAPTEGARPPAAAGMSPDGDPPAEDPEEAGDNAGATTGAGDSDGDTASTGDTGEAPKGVLAAASELAGMVDALLNGGDAATRKDAANQLLEREEGVVPEVIRDLAELELATRCKSKKSIIARLTERGDPQVLPALRRVSSLPKKGCGMFKQGDCWSCLRRTVKASITRLEKIEAGEDPDAEAAKKSTKKSTKKTTKKTSK
jgi:serine/threonine-protein kinase